MKIVGQRVKQGLPQTQLLVRILSSTHVGGAIFSLVAFSC
jgi:hypothetical protein